MKSHHLTLVKTTQVVEQFDLIPSQKVGLFWEEYENRGGIKQQAKEWWDDYILPSLVAGKPVALLYSANQKQAELLYRSYGHLNISLSKIFVGGSRQAELFKEIALLVEQHRCRDQIHILPIPTSLHGGDNRKPHHHVSLEHIDKSLENVAKHRGAGFEIMGLAQDRQINSRFSIGGSYSEDLNTNEALEVITAKPIEEWRPEWHAAFVAGLNKKHHLSIFKNVDPSILGILEELSDSDNQGIKQILERVYDYQANRLKKKDDGTIESVDSVNREATWSQIVQICKEHTSILGNFFQYNDPQINFIYRAMAEFDANLRWWPEISNVEELLIAQQKRDAVNFYFKKEYNRLTSPEGENLFDSSPTKKLVAYEQLVKAMMSSDKGITLSSILKEDSVFMMQPVIMNDNQDINETIKLKNDSGQVMTIQDALCENRSIFNVSQATSKSILNELRDQVEKMNPHTILNFSHGKSKKITKIATFVDQTLIGDRDGSLNESLINALLAANITHVYLTTDMVARILQIEKNAPFNRITLKKHLEKLGFIVTTVTAGDAVYQAGVGSMSSDFFQSYYKGEDSKKLTATRGYQDSKGVLYEYLFSQLPADISSVIVFDDKRDCLQSAKQAAQITHLSIPLTNIQIMTTNFIQLYGKGTVIPELDKVDIQNGEVKLYYQHQVNDSDKIIAFWCQDGEIFKQEVETNVLAMQYPNVHQLFDQLKPDIFITIKKVEKEYKSFVENISTIFDQFTIRKDDFKLTERDTTFAKYQYLINQHSQKLPEETIYNLSHPLFFALTEMRSRYLSLHRSIHTEDINKLIQEVSLIIRHSDNYQERISLILDRIQEAFDKEERHFCQPTLGLFGKGKSKDDFAKKLTGDEHCYEYPRMLKNILSNYSPMSKLAILKIK